MSDGPKREYDGPALDMTWKYLGSDGTTEEATPDASGEERTEVWPSVLPRDAFTELQAAIVEALVLNPDASNDSITEKAGCSASYVRETRHKCRVFAEPGSVPFGIPDRPRESSRNVVAAMEHPAALAEFGAGGRDRSEGGSSVEEVGERYYEGGESLESIGEDVDLSEAQLRGLLGAYQSSKKREAEKAEAEEEVEEAAEGVSEEESEEEAQVGRMASVASRAGWARLFAACGGGFVALVVSTVASARVAYGVVAVGALVSAVVVKALDGDGGDGEEAE